MKKQQTEFAAKWKSEHCKDGAKSHLVLCDRQTAPLVLDLCKST